MAEFRPLPIVPPLPLTPAAPPMSSAEQLGHALANAFFYNTQTGQQRFTPIQSTLDTINFLRAAMSQMHEPQNLIPGAGEIALTMAMPSAAFRPRPSAAGVFLGPVGVSKTDIYGLGGKDPADVRLAMEKMLKEEPSEAYKKYRMFMGREGVPKVELPDVMRGFESKLIPVEPDFYNIPPNQLPPSGLFQYWHPALGTSLHDMYNIPLIKAEKYPPGTKQSGSAGKTGIRIGFSPKEVMEEGVKKPPAPSAPVSLAGSAPVSLTGTRPFLPREEFTPRGIAGHEITHAIQGPEGFSIGANPIDMAHSPEYWSATGRSPPLGIGSKLAHTDQIIQAERRMLRDVHLSRRSPLTKQEKDLYDKAYGAYWNTAGEVEARNMPRRMLNPQLYDVHPWLTEDVPLSGQIKMEQIWKALGWR